MRIFRNQFVLLASDTRVTEKDLEKLLDNMLGSSIWGVVIGALFGGLVAAALTKGIEWLMVFNIFAQPVLESSVAFIVAVGLVFAVLVALYSASEASLLIKTRLMKQYLEAREVIRDRAKKKESGNTK